MMRLLEIHIYVSLVLLVTSVIATMLTKKSVWRMGCIPFSMMSILKASWMWFIPLLNIGSTVVAFLNTYCDFDEGLARLEQYNQRNKKH